jgi:hypothetical protein
MCERFWTLPGSGAQGGFRLASPVKKPVASELPRCVPPHTFRAGEEPEKGGTHLVGQLPLRKSSTNSDTGATPVTSR